MKKKRKKWTTVAKKKQSGNAALKRGCLCSFHMPKCFTRSRARAQRKRAEGKWAVQACVSMHKRFSEQCSPDCLSHISSEFVFCCCFLHFTFLSVCPTSSLSSTHRLAGWLDGCAWRQRTTRLCTVKRSMHVFPVMAATTMAPLSTKQLYSSSPLFLSLSVATAADAVPHAATC